MAFRSLLVPLVLCVPTLAAADTIAVARFRHELPNGDWHEVYVKAAHDTQARADAAAMRACDVLRRHEHSGSVIASKARCEIGSVADYELAQAVSEGAVQTASVDTVKPAAFKGR